MFLILGSPRSGTTLLAQILSAHPDIIVPFETNWIVPMCFIRNRIPDQAVGKPMIYDMITKSTLAKSVEEYMEPKQFYSAIYDAEYTQAAILESVYARIAENAGAKMAGDKSPHDLMYLPIFIQSQIQESDIKIIHIIRDVRDVATSVKRNGLIPDLDAHLPTIWSYTNMLLYNLFRQKTDRYIFFLYESLAEEPARVIRSLCQFLGIEFREQMLDPQNRHGRYRMKNQHLKIYSEISPQWIGQYREGLTREEVRDCEEQARQAMEFFGYEVSA